ncbi:MAG: right-handed parallel beta-helix repeat-containing protein [Myxococcales bacterium]|jgi:hypothetical protein
MQLHYLLALAIASALACTDTPRQECTDAACVEASFVSLVLDAPKPGAIKPVFDARAHLEPRSGSSPIAPERVSLVLEKAGAAAVKKDLLLVSGTYRYEGRVEVASFGTFTLRAESAETRLSSAPVSINVVACSADADCALCQACRDGFCVNQEPTEDIKDECEEGDCSTGLCDGAGACGFKVAGTVCRPAQGLCDEAELCTGNAPECPEDDVKPLGVICNAAAGDCDVEEKCDGVGKECPADTFKPADTECRPAEGLCDEPEFCSGTEPECPEDDVKPLGVVCNAAAGDCDVEEKCDGMSKECPPDRFEPATTVCRAAVDVCDVTENCSGNGPLCPEDRKQQSGTACGEPTCQGSTFSPSPTCDGAGRCIEADAEDCGAYICEPTGCLTACDDNSDCVAGLCDLRDGSCPLASAVTQLYCDANAEALQLAIDADCSAGTPCYLHVLAGTCDAITVQDRDVYIAGNSGTTISPLSRGPAVSALELSGESTRLALVDMTIQGASGPVNNPGDGVRCEGLTGNKPEIAIIRSTIGLPGAGVNTGDGIHATNCGLTIRESTIQNNSQAGISASSSHTTIARTLVSENIVGGIRLNQSSFTISNCLIINNGVTTSPSAFGGIRIIDTETPATLIHNTIASNGLIPDKPGVECIGSPVSIVNSLIWGNGAPTSTSSDVVNCSTTHPGSHIEGDESAQQCGAAAPGFSADYHLEPTSPCRDTVPCDAQVPTDFDGDERPQPPGSLCDVGADEIRPSP